METINICKINPYIRVAINSVLTDGTRIKQRALFDYELIFVESGRFILKYGDVSYECNEGQFILICPAVSHSFKCIYGDISQPHIHFDMIYTSKSDSTPVSFKDIKKFSHEELNLVQPDFFSTYQNTPFVIFTENDKALNLFRDIIQLSNSNRLLKAKSLLLDLLDMLISDNYPKLLSVNKQNRYTVSEQIKDFIDAGQGMYMSLDDFEKQFSYSKFYLERQFKSKYGIGLIAYRDKIRFENACKMLKSKSVSETASKCGFSSVYVFSRAFKNKMGINPTEYKEKASQ